MNSRQEPDFSGAYSLDHMYSADRLLGDFVMENRRTIKTGVLVAAVAGIGLVSGSVEAGPLPQGEEGNLMETLFGVGQYIILPGILGARAVSKAMKSRVAQIPKIMEEIKKRDAAFEDPQLMGFQEIAAEKRESGQSGNEADGPKLKALKEKLKRDAASAKAPDAGIYVNQQINLIQERYNKAVQEYLKEKAKLRRVSGWGLFVGSAVEGFQGIMGAFSLLTVLYIGQTMSESFFAESSSNTEWVLDAIRVMSIVYMGAIAAIEAWKVVES